MMQESPLIVCTGLVKIHKVADLEVVALQGLDLTVARGELLALIGPSGSGKSTLLSLLAGLDRPSAGQLEVDGQDLLTMSSTQLTTYRREHIGVVWQQTSRNLIPYLSARANIELLMTLRGVDGAARRAWADELLRAMGMLEHAERRPTELSGGQQQRIAIGCALANRPPLLLADEPTGEFDWPTAQRILTLLRDLRDRYQLTMVIVTHDMRVAEQADRVVAIRDGKTSVEIVRAQPGATRAADSQTELQPPAVQEYVVLDHAGRLQLPSEQRALVGIQRRARVRLVDGGFLITSADDQPLPEQRGEEGDPSTAAQQLYTPPLEVEQEQPLRRWRWRWR